MDARFVNRMSIAGFIEEIRLGLGRMPFDIISGLDAISFSLLLINSHNLEPETSGCGGELRVVGQQ
jgi:hypothetical protein